MLINICTTITATEDPTGRGTYHRALADLLTSAGHEVVCTDKPIHAAAYIGTPDALRRVTGLRFFIIHSDAKEMTNMQDGHIIYVAKHLHRKWAYACQSSYVLHPMVKYPLTERKAGFRGVIGQINLYHRKGGNTLYEMAEKFPQYRFIGVMSWGRQIIKPFYNVTIQDFTPDLTTFYQSIDILLNPSLSEGLPTVNLEAMSFGVPVIGSDIPGNRESGAIVTNDFESAIKSIAANYQPIYYERPDNGQFIQWVNQRLGI